MKKLTIPTILVPDESSDASEQCGNDVDPMDAAIDDALDLVEAALLEMSNFTLGDRKLPTLSPVLSSKVVGFFFPQLCCLLSISVAGRQCHLRIYDLRFSHECKRERMVSEY